MRLDLNYVIDNHRKIITCVFVAFIAVTLAFITSNIVAIATEGKINLKSIEDSIPAIGSGMLRRSRSLSYYSPIVERNIFDSQNRQPEEKKEETRAYAPTTERSLYDGPPVKSTMNATLVGTMVFSDPAYSFAKIARGSSGESESYYVGDSLFGEATVKRVERNRVYIRREGGMEYLEIEGPKATVMPSYSQRRASASYHPSPRPEPKQEAQIATDDVRKVGDNKYVLDKSMVDSLLSNYNEVLTQARAVPNFKDGKANGFKIFAIKRKSIYSAIGIKNGDVLTRVNGSEINNLEKVLSLFTQLRNENNITIDLERRGQKMSFEYEIR